MAVDTVESEGSSRCGDSMRRGEALFVLDELDGWVGIGIEVSIILGPFLKSLTAKRIVCRMKELSLGCSE
jgi:hypothetical protein